MKERTIASRVIAACCAIAATFAAVACAFTTRDAVAAPTTDSASGSIAKRATGRGLSTRKNLVCGVSVTVQIRVGTWNRHLNGICICRHGGGGTGETGDRHRCGGCHSYEALKNLVHISSFS